MACPDEYDWNDNDAVTLRSYGSVAVYENPHGSVVIRQQRDALEDEDSTVIIPVHHADLIASEILAVAKAVREADVSRGDASGRENAKPARQERLALPSPISRAKTDG